MSISEGDKWIIGPLDVVLVLHDINTGRYHLALFIDRPFPGPLQPVGEVSLVRLMSQMHHAEGAETLEGALAHVDELLARMVIPAENTYRKAAIEWDGELGIVAIGPNWRQSGVEQPFDPTLFLMNLCQAVPTH